VNFTPFFWRKKVYNSLLRMIRAMIKIGESIGKIIFVGTPKKFRLFKKIRGIERINKPTSTALII
jgi:hypothetical protein